MKVIVFGAGMMGGALAYDLAQADGLEYVILADKDFDRAVKSAKSIGEKVIPIKVDVDFYNDVFQLMQSCDVAISAVPYSYNLALTKAAIEVGIHFLDLGGNNDVVKQQLLLDGLARQNEVCVLPNCGLAPGFVNILAIGGAKEFDSVEEIHLRVGGLPQHPRPPLNYQLVFSAEGLLNEYTEPAEVIRNGNIILVDSMDDVEEIVFSEPYGTLEAFNASGGVSTLCHQFLGKVRELDYKTIRYKGHCEKFKMLLDLGFASNEPIIIGNGVRTARELFADMLRRKLDYGDTDLVLLRAIITGIMNGSEKTLQYEMIDLFDENSKISAMMRTTSFPTSIIAQMLARGVIKARGVMPPEDCVPVDLLITELKKRNINIQKKYIQGVK
ncbi:MAG: saccharopine dehydrogenase NADP-binding domain-containing protein [Bacteroidetes bacterium]|nr:saccharopine dehydrogenase NADP-binding domain-containing protein [Bacteroidota bacterium]MBU1422909.1 saccharopine dehydrogenase NADP-binding domain-containing protein [Bacteroidota bacterium]MBU2636029.1 saccharopine dehydrogenase NADP-binding domain-containing protein [Bacteroidota bacterium]